MNSKKGLIEKTKQKARLKKLIDNPEPIQYIDTMIKMDLSAVEKRKLGRKFMKRSGLNSAEVIKARNRHPYYKQLKNKNHTENQRKRNQFNRGKKRPWKEKELREFYLLSPDYSDIKLAEHFGRSIPSINAVRRRINLINKIISMAPDERKKISSLIIHDDKKLKKILDSLINK